MNRQYYKGRYLLAFYSSNDEEPLYVFNNIREICEFLEDEPTRAKLQYLKLLIYKALKRDNHITYILGKKMKVYMIDNEDDTEEEE